MTQLITDKINTSNEIIINKVGIIFNKIILIFDLLEYVNLCINY